MKESDLVKILKLGIYAAALAPLVIFSEFISPFHFGKVIVFRSLIEILLVFYLVLIWRNRAYLPSRTSIFWSFFAFTAVFGFTTVTSIQIYDSFWGFLERMGGFWSFIHYFVYFVILISIFRTKEDWLRLLDVALVVGLLSDFYGFGQKTDIKFFVGSGNRARIFGTIGNAALFSGYELIIVFLSLMFFFKEGNSQFKKILYGTVFFLSSIAVLMTAVRGSVLGLAVGLFVFITLYVFVSKSRKARTYFLYLVVLVILLFAASQFFRDSDLIKNSKYLSRITDLSLKSYTVQTRLWAWEAGIRGWKESPKTILLGWGPENFNIPFSKNFNPNFYAGPGSETLFDRAHNMFVEVLVTMGILGFLAYVSLFYFSLKNLWNKFSESGQGKSSIFYLGLISLVVAYVVHNFFFFDTSANFILFFTVFGFINFVCYTPSEISRNDKKISRLSNLQIASIAILLIPVGYLIYLTNIVPSLANYATTRGIVRSWQGDYVGAVEKFKESLAYQTFGAYEYRHRYAQLVFENYSKLKDPKYIIYAIDEVKKSAENRPNDYLPNLYLSRLNILLGKDDASSPYNDTALVYAEKAIKLSPTFVRAYHETGQVYLNKKQYEKAALEFQKAAELNPDVGVSFWYWGMVELQLQNFDKAAEIFEKALTAPYPNTDISENDLVGITKLYLDRNNFNMLAVIYERLINLKPDNPNYRASLAYVYAKLGRVNEALEQARIAVKLDSGFEAEAREFVKALGREL